MPWIETIEYSNATSKLKKLYDRVKGPDNNVDNVMMIHSLRPQSMEGHMTLYKNVLHHTGNTIPKWFLETIGVWVSSLNDCHYCVDHHYCGLKRLIGDNTKSNAIKAAIDARDFTATPLDNKHIAALEYARQLTQNPGALHEGNVTSMRKAGYSDGEILEINQVSAYFNYANRTVLGLGCTIEGDILGLSPNNSKDTQDWGHQ